jgi:hypothetical protein
MPDTIEVPIPLDPDAAQALGSPARRQAAGRYLSALLRGGRVRDVLAEAIAEAKLEARARGLSDDEVNAELDAWRAERHA